MPAGLAASDAAARLAQFGPNALPEPSPEPMWRRFLRQLASPLTYILLCALAFDIGAWVYEGAQGAPIEATAIALILAFNALLGLYQETRSEAALAKLKVLAGAYAWALRDDEFVRISTREIVPGDRLRLEAGDRVPADGVLAEAHGALMDESVLTGESVPVDRGSGDEVLSGTLLVRGRVLVDVSRTGSTSAMGRLAAMLGGIATEKTPLERRVDRLGHQIARGVLALAAMLAAIGLVAEGADPAILIAAVALAVAAVPEGLPAAVTVALSLGVERMARRRAVVRRLAAVEALGSVTVIATDKTGTLTENRMDVRALDASDRERALAALVLANDADLDAGTGDPIDLGLLRYAQQEGIDVAELRAQRPTVADRPFDSAWKFSRVTVTEADGPISYLKGAPEVVIDLCTLPPSAAREWKEKAEAAAAQGFRVLAAAWGHGSTEDRLALAGLVHFWDPPRAEVPDAVRQALHAGIRVVMITGDHPSTALAVAHQINIPGDTVLSGEALARLRDDQLADTIRNINVFARVRPEQKLRLVEALRASGNIVAMTGDGVNDAPALKRSDVGVAMGQRGSDVSREVADLVLLDDNFATIVAAVDEGRNIYGNIQTFLRFLFSTNLSEVLLVTIGTVLAYGIGLRDVDGSLMLPLTAAQILWINLLTDGLPALALAFDRTPDVMNQRPRPGDSALLSGPSIRFIVAVGTTKALIALGLLGLVPRLGYELPVARSTVFHFMAIGQLLLTYTSRHADVRPLPNRLLHGAVLLGIVFQVLAAAVPALAVLLGAVRIPLALWAVVFAAAGVIWPLSELISRRVWGHTAADQKSLRTT